MRVVVLVPQIAAWQRQRNHEGARVRWLFGIEQARHKLYRLYPTTLSAAALLAA